MIEITITTTAMIIWGTVSLVAIAVIATLAFKFLKDKL